MAGPSPPNPTCTMNELTSVDPEELQARFPKKFVAPKHIFAHINRGDRIFVHTGCGEPQHLVNAMVDYVENNPKAFVDTELYHVWTLGLAPYTDEKYRRNFRHNSFFIATNTREAINRGQADYTPIFLSNVPNVFRRGLHDLDVALIQVSPPDRHNCVSLGVSVDIVKAAIQNADVIIAQVNPCMPRVHGDGFLSMDEIDYCIYHAEDLLEFDPPHATEVAERIGTYCARIIQDGDTIQVGYGSIPNALMKHLHEKKHLGVHTELFGDGLAELVRAGVVDNSRKTLNRGKTIASFSMGRASTYELLHDNPSVELRGVDYTNDPLVIAQQRNMVAINSALELDLTGQASADSLGEQFFSGIGGQADFMRGAVLAPNGRTILALPSTAEDGEVSRIVTRLQHGAGVTLTRGDIHYVVTEYGIAYLHGKNVRERAMALIAIAHPKFRGQLLEEAKERRLVYQDQAFIPGKRGEYPEHLETYRTTKTGDEIFLRPVRLSDEPLLKDFYYDLSEQSMYRRFISRRRDMPHERLQESVVIDYTTECVILATQTAAEGAERVLGVGQYGIHSGTHTAEVALAVRDQDQNRCIGRVLLTYLTVLAKREGLLGFTAEVVTENQAMLHLFESMGFDIDRRNEEGVFELRMAFREDTDDGND